MLDLARVFYTCSNPSGGYANTYEMQYRVNGLAPARNYLPLMTTPELAAAALAKTLIKVSDVEA